MNNAIKFIFCFSQVNPGIDIVGEWEICDATNRLDGLEQAPIKKSTSPRASEDLAMTERYKIPACLGMTLLFEGFSVSVGSDIATDSTG